jgi:IS605 OrfB family transposase
MKEKGEKSYTIITRRIKINVNEVNDKKRKDFYGLLRGFNELSSEYANLSISQLQAGELILNNVKNKYNIKTAKELNEKYKELYGMDNSSVAYSNLKLDWKDKLPSPIRSSINVLVRADFNNNKSDVKKGVRSLTTYKKSYPTPFTRDWISTFIEDRGDFIFSFGNSGLNIPMKTYLGKDKSNNFDVIANINKGIYTLCDSSYMIDGKDFYLLLAVKIPKVNHEFEPGRSMGVDLGINIPCVLSINDVKFVKYIGSKADFFDRRLGLQKRRRELQRNMTLNNGGKGRKKKLQALDRLSESERNFVKNYNHNLSKAIINHSLSNNCGIINLEDLSGIGKQEKSSLLLKNWSYFELQTMITNKATKNNIKVNIINAKYSSQRCSKCGYIHEDNRLEQAKFICGSCGEESNADENAARNIAIAHKDEYIKQIELHGEFMKKTKKVEA